MQKQHSSVAGTRIFGAAYGKIRAGLRSWPENLQGMCLTTRVDKMCALDGLVSGEFCPMVGVHGLGIRSKRSFLASLFAATSQANDFRLVSPEWRKRKPFRLSRLLRGERKKNSNGADHFGGKPEEGCKFFASRRPPCLDLRVKFYFLRIICLDLLLEASCPATQPSRPPQAFDLLAVPQYYSSSAVAWRTPGLDVLPFIF